MLKFTIFTITSLAGMIISHLVPSVYFWYWVALSLLLGHLINLKVYSSGKKIQIQSPITWSPKTENRNNLNREIREQMMRSIRLANLNKNRILAEIVLSEDQAEELYKFLYYHFEYEGYKGLKRLMVGTSNLLYHKFDYTRDAITKLQDAAIKQYLNQPVKY
jgi:hypothetical protein